MAAERDERLYLSDIVTSIDRILEYTAAGRQSFLDDQLTQDAVVRNIEILGEAARHVSDATRQANPQIPWNKIVGTRDASSTVTSASTWTSSGKSWRPSCLVYAAK
jgi:uncharacterized protein with HEPN domain